MCVIRSLAGFALVCAGLSVSLHRASAASPAAVSSPGRIHDVELRGMIHPVSAAYLESAIDAADADHAAALIIEIDTPGGLVDDTKHIVQKMLAAHTPIIGFVTPSGARAASGGFCLLIACDASAMAPGTNTGAAHPVFQGGDNTKENIELQKTESDLAAFVRSLAENRGRNAKLAETAVTKSVSWTEKEALAGHLIDVIAKDRADLLAKLDGHVVTRMDGGSLTLDLKGPVVPSRPMTALEQVQNFVLTPMIASLLILVGMLGIYIEMTHPGVILPGVVGAVALLVFAYAAHILPVSVVGLLLLATGVVLFILEIKITSHGLLGLGGVAALVAGSLLLFNGPIPELRLPVAAVLPTSLALAGFMALITRYVVRAQKGRVTTGAEGMVGEVGIAQTELAPEGKIFVHGEYWNAKAEGVIPRGTRVRIRAVGDLVLLVEPEGRAV